MTTLARAAAIFLVFAACFPALAEDDTAPVECTACSSKALSPHRSQLYLEKALSASNPEDTVLWLSIALRYDPNNSEARHLLRELSQRDSPGAKR